MKLILNGTLDKVGPVVNKESYMFQNILIKVQNFNRTTGEPEKPEFYEATIFNKKIDELNATELLGQLVSAETWTRSIEKEVDDKRFYNIALNCSKLTKL